MSASPGEHAETDDAPVAAARRELVDVHREVRAVKTADSHVHDGRTEARPVVGGHRDPAARDLGETGLTEGDRAMTGPRRAHYKQR